MNILIVGLSLFFFLSSLYFFVDSSVRNESVESSFDVAEKPKNSSKEDGVVVQYRSSSIYQNSSNTPLAVDESLKKLINTAPVVTNNMPQTIEPQKVKSNFTEPYKETPRAGISSAQIINQAKYNVDLNNSINAKETNTKRIKVDKNET